MKITNSIYIKPGLSVSDYFDYRAPRYNNAIQQLPFARSLDMLPYCFAISLLESSTLNILDAFCGTGFISNSLKSLDANFVLADISEGMINSTNDNKKRVVTTDGFNSVVESFGKESFDVVLSHGGFHHAIELIDNKVSKTESLNKHRDIINNLISLVKKNGILIIADIPENTVPDFFNPSYALKEKLSKFTHIIGEEHINYIAKNLSVDPEIPTSLNELNELIYNKVYSKVNFPVPKYFFNQYIARHTKHGHKACYPDFEMIDSWIMKESKFEKLSSVNFYSPWIFDSINHAGWFFKEKFSLFEKSELLINKPNEKRVYDLLEKYLGVTKFKDKIFVNWGVTYLIYKKTQ